MSRPPNRTELAKMIMRLHLDDPRRQRMEELYWVLVAEECGAQRAQWWREEVEWLRANR